MLLSNFTPFLSVICAVGIIFTLWDDLNNTKRNRYLAQVEALKKIAQKLSEEGKKSNNVELVVVRKKIKTLVKSFELELDEIKTVLIYVSTFGRILAVLSSLGAAILLFISGIYPELEFSKWNLLLVILPILSLLIWVYIYWVWEKRIKTINKDKKAIERFSNMPSE